MGAKKVESKKAVRRARITDSKVKAKPVSKPKDEERKVVPIFAEKREAKNKVYQIVTDRIMAALEAGKIPWRQPWKSGVAMGGQGFNMVTGKAYRGINVMLTMGFERPGFLSLKQIEELGGTLKDDAYYTMIVYYKDLIFNEGQEDEKKIYSPRYSKVYNIDQIVDGPEGKIEALYKKRVTEPVEKFKPIVEAERVIAGMKNPPKIHHNGGDRAYYKPMFDSVHLPVKQAFHTPEDYYTTVFHELAHSTGAKKRLHREGIETFHHFGDPIYAKEELVAEMTSAFLNFHCQFEKGIEASASYIQGWLKALKNDPMMVLQASSQAQKAADYILGIEYKSENDETEPKAEPKAEAKPEPVKQPHWSDEVK